MENCLAIPKFVFPCPPGPSSHVWTYEEEHHHAGSRGEHILLQNLQMAASIQGNVLGEEEKTPSAVISAENTSYHYTLGVVHRITVDLES